MNLCKLSVKYVHALGLIKESSLFLYLMYGTYDHIPCKKNRYISGILNQYMDRWICFPSISSDMMENKFRVSTLLFDWRKMSQSIKEKIKRVYKKYATGFDEKIASLEIYNESYDFLLKKIQDGAAILDLACGPGNVSHYLKRHKPGLKITGVDISEEMIDIAQTRIQDGKFIARDICEVEFSAKFDCVICAFGIPYLDLNETAKVFKIISKSLYDNGHFYISYIEGSKQDFAKQSFTDNEELFIFRHPEIDILEILDQQALSVIKRFDIDYHEKDGTIIKEIIYIGNLLHNKAN
jgi:predicted TPR repeat methyltransferase